ncbi:unnamed protein product, partial [Choristocarpus tenellus]
HSDRLRRRGSHLQCQDKGIVAVGLVEEVSLQGPFSCMSTILDDLTHLTYCCNWRDLVQSRVAFGRSVAGGGKKRRRNRQSGRGRGVSPGGGGNGGSIQFNPDHHPTPPAHTTHAGVHDPPAPPKSMAPQGKMRVNRNSRTSSTTMSQMMETKFSSLPLCPETLKAINEVLCYETMTKVQHHAIPRALSGNYTCFSRILLSWDMASKFLLVVSVVLIVRISYAPLHHYLGGTIYMPVDCITCWILFTAHNQGLPDTPPADSPT